MPMEFQKRLERAIERGQQTRNEKGRLEAEKALSAEELKSQHTRYRLELSEHIEGCLKQLADQFPGFEFQTVVDNGWGGKISRDDLTRGPGRSVQSLYSRLEMVIRPYSDTRIVELVVKGAIRNKEVLKRSHYQFLAQVDFDSFRELIDLWVLEYAEKYAATD
ncbi:MAG: hypothetical protein ACE5KM_10370 [Planctomycetaceae bacterium]